MHETEHNGSQILSDGRSVWVNAADGCCTGRFARGGVDIHLDGEQQVKQGIECIDCFDRTDDFEQDWQRFTRGMKQHYGVEINDEHKPSSTATYQGLQRMSFPKAVDPSLSR
jgi:hypothetical protein